MASVSQATRDALADARTLVLNSTLQYGDDLWHAQADGSCAVVAALDGCEGLARVCALAAAAGAFAAVPALREQ